MRAVPVFSVRSAQLVERALEGGHAVFEIIVDLWQRALTQRRKDLALGGGKLAVSGLALLDALDIGRKLVRRLGLFEPAVERNRQRL